MQAWFSQGRTHFTVCTHISAGKWLNDPFAGVREAKWEIKKANYSVSVDGRPISHSVVFNSVNRAGESEGERGRARESARQTDRLGEGERACVCECDRGREADKRSHQQKHRLAVH